MRKRDFILLLVALLVVRCSDYLDFSNVRATKFGCSPSLLKASMLQNLEQDKRKIRAIHNQGFYQKDFNIVVDGSKNLKMTFPIGAAEALRDLHPNSEIRVFGNLLDNNTIEVGPKGLMALAEFHVFPAINIIKTISKKVYADPSGIPPLNSLPGALATLYLDFDGHTEAQWGSFSNIVIPPYDQDNDPTTFSVGEINNIQKIWEAVSEDYAPYNINVTTVVPPNFNDGVALRASIGGNSSWTGVQAGGVAYINSFTNYIPNVVFIFPKNLSNGDPKNTAVAASHEAGHAFGLKHQSKYDANGNKIEEYSTGPGDGTAPLMGLAYNATRSLWWYGPNAVSATTIQDDMAIISGDLNGFRYRADDVGNTIASATALNVDQNNVSASGVLHAVNDIDMFYFDTEMGPITLNINPKEAPIMNLDLKAELFDSQGNSIAISDPANSFAASIQISVGQGRYYLAVSSHGGYGNVGQYSVSGTILSSSGGLNAPSNLRVVSVQVSGVNLSWNDNSNNETGFVIQSSLNGSSWNTLDTVSANTATYTDTSINPGTLYYYRVKAVNEITSSNFSNTVSATTIPAIPSNFGATANSSSTISLSWNDVTGETGYTLERSLNGAQWSVIATVSANVVSYQNTGLNPSTLYYYRIKSENASGSSGYSSVSSARTFDPNSPPSAPTNLVGSIIGIGITLSWTDNSNNEDSFILYRSVNNGPSTQLAELPANTVAYGDTNVQLGSTYKYIVKAKNNYGLSSASNEVTISMSCQ